MIWNTRAEMLARSGLHVHIHQVCDDECEQAEREQWQPVEADAAVAAQVAHDQQVKEGVAYRHDRDGQQRGSEGGVEVEPHEFGDAERTVLQGVGGRRDEQQV